jgi:hypothetical protein
MTMMILATIVCLLALMPAVMIRRNLSAYAPPAWAPKHRHENLPAISLLIPARDEEQNIRASLEAALASDGVRLEVLVLDDHSEDATAATIGSLAAQDPRLRLLSAPPLPAGWCGKQHACAILAQQAQYPILAFIDADVRLAPHGLARLASFLRTSGADLVSGIPRQETSSALERLLIPLIHFLLLGFLPFQRMRHSRHPAYGSGCGQLFMTHHAAYQTAGGHAAIRASLHDGLTLPRAYRAAGLMTDLCDATDLATCRMYRQARDVWHGLAKNATEGLAAHSMIVPATAVLVGGQVLPYVLFAMGVAGGLTPPALGLTAVAVGSSLYARFAIRRRFQQPWISLLLHPVGMLVLLAIQWYAWWQTLRGYPPAWKGRQYAKAPTTV